MPSRAHPILKDDALFKKATTSSLHVLTTNADSDMLPFSNCSRAQLLLSSPHVHFPPTPILTSTHDTHSARIYDRAPIIVAHNKCAIPEREAHAFPLPVRELKGSYFHPRAREACEKEPPTALPDLSFSSESASSDSDLDYLEVYGLNSPTIHNIIPRAVKLGNDSNSLSFLPHAPSDIEYLESPIPISPSRPKCKRRSTPGRVLRRDASSFSEASMDDGCLGGF